MAYSEADKMLLASLIMMNVSAMQSENDIRKAEGRQMKYDAKDFYKSVEYAHRDMREF
ncbi:hypothetical protein [Bacillus sp. AFS096315]|uniref:hypothetical protein n=1 Tax=Bacillus sp. AFS096315 TaxID=2033517 RepID=UPI001596B499|nr:hypothetical protein [Bacillus sp. AFS096315]